MVEGDAYGVEKVLHYWFRERALPVPHGPGYTEWFSADAWPHVLAFLAAQRTQLGLGDAMPVLTPPIAGSPRVQQPKKKPAVDPVAHNCAAAQLLEQMLALAVASDRFRGLVADERSKFPRACLFVAGALSALDVAGLDFMSSRLALRRACGRGGRSVFTAAACRNGIMEFRFGWSSYRRMPFRLSSWPSGRVMNGMRSTRIVTSFVNGCPPWSPSAGAFKAND